MPRKPNPPAPQQELAPINEEAVIAAQRAGAVSTERDLALMEHSRRIGRMQMTDFYGNVSARIMAEEYARLKESKTWQWVPCPGPDGKLKQVSSLDEYCQVAFGKGYRRMEQILANANLLGDLYEQAEAIGLGQRDYQALKLLPEDDQAVIRQAIEGGADHATVIEQLVTLTERQVSQKRALQDELQKAHQQIETKDQRAKVREDELEQLTAKLAKAKRDRAKATPEATAKELRERVQVAVMQARADLFAQGADVDSLRERIRELGEWASENDQANEHQLYMAGAIAEVMQGLAALRDEFGLPDVQPEVWQPSLTARG